MITKHSKDIPIVANEKQQLTVEILLIEIATSARGT